MTMGRLLTLLGETMMISMSTSGKSYSESPQILLACFHAPLFSSFGSFAGEFSSVTCSFV